MLLLLVLSKAVRPPYGCADSYIPDSSVASDRDSHFEYNLPRSLVNYSEQQWPLGM